MKGGDIKSPLQEKKERRECGVPKRTDIPIWDAQVRGAKDSGLLETDAVRGHREGSVARADARRRNHVGIHRISFDYLLVAWVIRISRIHRFIPRSARHRARFAHSAFRERAKRHHIKDKD
jgi:hypothetical protein